MSYRCFACCQENCAYSSCDCYCHDPLDVVRAYPSVAEANRKEATRSPCKSHRRYQAKRKPTTGCEACWRYYVEVNP